MRQNGMTIHTPCVVGMQLLPHWCIIPGDSSTSLTRSLPIQKKNMKTTLQIVINYDIVYMKKIWLNLEHAGKLTFLEMEPFGLAFGPIFKHMKFLDSFKMASVFSENKCVQMMHNYMKIFIFHSHLCIINIYKLYMKIEKKRGQRGGC